MNGRLGGKVAVVTGAGSGIGKAMVERFIAEGARVVAADISGKQNALSVLGVNCLPFECDVSKSADVQAMFAAAVSNFGGLHVLCNNAAIAGLLAPIGEYPEEEWARVIAVNLTGVFLGMRYGIPLMLESGGGSIINTTSIGALVAAPMMSAYCTAKGGIEQMTKTAAVEYAAKNIRANTIRPGTTRTEMIAGVGVEYMQPIIDAHPIKRIADPKEVANLALFLASDEASFITASGITIDGGYTAI